MSCLQAINSYCDNPFITEILQLHDHLATSQYEVVFCWLPSHVGINGNTLADAAAKAAHDSSITAMQIPYIVHGPGPQISQTGPFLVANSNDDF